MKAVHPFAFLSKMFRLTLSGSAPTQFRKNTNPVTQSIYRWGDCWGILREGDWAQRWTVEVRLPLVHETIGANSVLLESVCSVDDVAGPPVHLDDFWKEEVEVDGSTTCGTLLSILGTATEIQDICKKARIPLSHAVNAFLTADKSDSKIQHVM